MLNSLSALASSSLLVLALSCVVSAAAAPFSSWAGKRSLVADNGGGGRHNEVGLELSAPEIRQLIYDLGR